ncbi:type VI secretion system tube protein Hcp [Enterobacter sp. CGMCC 5087]|uniref:Hcp family type VI secretion system effector n=1 Tax=Enterobacter sp. CGMCC 5087 TaxID=2183878 RepID=UPI000D67EFA9|nr:Hcp family type VI secretion system effector [Enterobacter sp. CGMCC 5087]PWI77356.1 type VI secretion system tube protein Hcp [Enterobacter sp. CGMCC 5087]
MPAPCYISITGARQGLITKDAFTADSVGNNYVEGHKDEMMVQAFKHIITVPTDPQSGQPSGLRVHKPFKFTVTLNKAVPLLYNALASGELLDGVALKWYRISAQGQREHFFTTALTDATIVDINLHMPHCQDENEANYTQLVEVSLAYRKIEWEHIVGNTSGSDDWRAPTEA